MPRACQNATVTSLPVTPGAVPPPLSPSKAARHGGEYADSVWRGGLPKQRPCVGFKIVDVVVAGTAAACPRPVAPAVCDAACCSDCRIVSALSSGGALGFSAADDCCCSGGG